MYPRLVTTSSGKKRKVTYLRLLEKVKKNGRWIEKALVNLGRQDIEGRKALGELLKKLRRFTDEVLVTPEEIESRQTKEYGPFLVGQKLWREIGLDRWITECCGEIAPVSLGEPGVLAMVLNRLTAPRSKLALYDWMPTVYLPEWQTKEFEGLPKDPTDFAEWFYQSMDWLVKGKNKEKIEECIVAWARTLFAIEVVFYDITNIQFEGWEKLKQARHGFIRLGRKNHKQILLGVVMMEGLPVASYLFRGNRAEKTTLLWVKDKLKKQFNVSRIVFVCDRGMISEENLAEIEAQKDGYIVALKRRRCEEVKHLLQEDLASFTPVQTDRDGEATLYAWEAPMEKGKRCIIVFDPVKAQGEKKKEMEVIRELEHKLEDLRLKVRRGEVNKVDHIIAAAEHILSHNHGKLYFHYQAKQDGHFEFSPNEEGRALVKKLYGKSVVKTSEYGLSLKESVSKSKGFVEVEEAFPEMEAVVPLLSQDPASYTLVRTGKKGKIVLSACEGPAEEDKRRVVAFNPLKAPEERKKRSEVIEELESELSELQKKVEAGKPKKVQLVCAAAERILSRKHGKRYFHYRAEKDGHFEFGPNEEGRALEEKLDGKFVIKTTERNLSLKEVVFKYKDLMDVEDGFRDLKDFIRTAPVFHWRYRRVKAHVFICVLALLLERYLEQKLRKAGLKFSARKVLEKLKTIRVVDNQVGPLILKYVTPPNQELDKILAACGIFKLPNILPDFKRVKAVGGSQEVALPGSK